MCSHSYIHWQRRTVKKMVMGESAGGDVYRIGQHMLTNGKVCYSKIQLSSEEVVST